MFNEAGWPKTSLAKNSVKLNNLIKPQCPHRRLDRYSCKKLLKVKELRWSPQVRYMILWRNVENIFLPVYNVMAARQWNVVEDMMSNCHAFVGWSRYQSVLCSCFEEYRPVWQSWSMSVDHISRAFKERNKRVYSNTNTSNDTKMREIGEI